MAIATCARDVIVAPDTVITGEIDLSGEIRSINNLDKRIREAEKLGFKNVIIPKSNFVDKSKYSINIIEVQRLTDAITACVHK